jgi:urease accessory protein
VDFAAAGSRDALARSRLCVAPAPDQRSVVTRALSTAPLRLWAPASPGRAAWVYQASLGGGFVGRDAIALDVEVAAGARLFLTSQASSKVYRRAASRVELDATVGDGGVLVAWPDPIACFAGATLDQHQRVRLAPTAGLIAVDAWTAGRVAHGERWAFERLALRTELELAGAPVAVEATTLCAAHGDLAARMAGAQACASVIIAGPPFAAAIDALARALADQPIAPTAAAAGERIAISVWPWGAVLRFAAATTERLTQALYLSLGPPVRDALGADPFTRKW